MKIARQKVYVVVDFASLEPRILKVFSTARGAERYAVKHSARNPVNDGQAVLEFSVHGTYRVKRARNIYVDAASMEDDKQTRLLLK